MHIFGSRPDGLSHAVLVDKSRSLVAIDVLHHKIHEGAAFAYFNYDNDIDIAAPKYFRLVVGANKAAHFDFSCTLLTAGTLSLIESPTISGNGTNVSSSIRNLNRLSTLTPELTIFEDPTVTAETNVIGLWRIGTAGGFANSSIGGSGSNRHEYILKPGLVYAFKITTDADNNRSWLAFEWYEV